MKKIPIVLAVLSIVYLPTLLYPYVLTDEAWIIRPYTASWVYPMGRFGFSLITWITGEFFKRIGLDVIYLMRGSAIVALAISAVLITRWFETWGQKNALPLSIALMTLPAYQIVVAAGTQLSVAILLAVSATLVSYQAFKSSPWLYLASSALLACCILIYQQMVLVAFALLVVPLMLDNQNKNTYKFVFAHSLVVTLTSVAYFICWKLAYHSMFPGRVDTRYGPAAVQLPTLDYGIAAVTDRVVQTASLWSVEYLSNKVIVLATLILVAAAAVFIIRQNWKFGVIAMFMVFGLFVASDGFAVLARAAASYVSAPAVSFVMFYLAFFGASVILKTYMKYIAWGVVCIGAVMAYTSVKELAIANWSHMETIRQALVENPHAVNFHILGSDHSRNKRGEYAWLTAATDVYLDLMANNEADDLMKRGIIDADRRAKMHFSVERVQAWSNPDGRHATRRPDSIVVDLPYR